MRLRAILVFTAALSVLLAVFAPAEALWDRNGNLVSGAAGEDSGPFLVPDGAGGMIVAWSDNSGDVYAQRMDGTGAPMWAAGGVYIASDGYDVVGIVTDGAGGAIVVWHDGLAETLHAARILPGGSLPWPAGAVEIRTSDPPTNITVAPDGSGGVLVAWLAYSGGTQGYIQKLGNDGSELWTENGLQYSATVQPNGEFYFPDVVSDGAGGALVAYTDNNQPSAVYVQRVYSNETVWSSSGTHANYNSGLANSGFDPCVALNGAGGAWVAWQKDAGDGTRIQAQIITPSGSRALASSIAVSGASEDGYTNPDIISDGVGGAYIVWEQHYGSWRIYAQRVDAYGRGLWATDGIAMNAGISGDQIDPRVMDAGSGNIMVTWLLEYHGSLPSAHAQKLDPGGTILWDPDVTLILPDAYNGDLDVACDGSGGVMAVVPKETSPGEVDIYGQSINTFGRPAAPEPVIERVTDVPGDQGGSVRITIGSSDRDRLDQGPEQVSSYDVWQRIDGPLMLSGSAVIDEGVYLPGKEDGGDGLTVYNDGARRFVTAAPGGVFPAGTWELVGSFGASQADEYIYRASTLIDSVGTAYNYSIFTVAAMTTNPSVWFVSAPDSGFSVDNLAPAPPLGLAGEQSFAPEGLQLTWDPNTENDFWYYAIYRGAGGTPYPSLAELIATPQTGEYFDGSWTWDEEYWYLVKAVDIHGNESDYAVLTYQQITGEDPAPVPDATFLAQNYPNPFNPVTTIAFGLKASGHVSLSVFDAAGRLVNTLVDETMPAGNHSVEWNGMSTGGASAASGVYFYRLTTAEFENTRKMILLR
jgi:hypothetical protein